MRTKTHVLLAKHLLNQMPTFDLQIHKKAFIFGCVQPDYNKLTYLKGYSRHHSLKGHNYSSTSGYICHVSDKLQGKARWSLRDYYRLGKLTHYISDSFTYPHNDDFPGTIWEHKEYEARLHILFADYLKEHAEEAGEYSCNVVECVSRYHREYMLRARDIYTDAEFITRATGRVTCALLYSRAAERRQYKWPYKLLRETF